ncbi:hypothetical protein, partial [Klebsiella pneumoniae]|uniref:hypothetical protein n=1 Tax=Klebsiella pneumoniae TaxID=573 RepID=UPI0039C8DC1A
AGGVNPAKNNPSWWFMAAKWFWGWGGLCWGGYIFRLGVLGQPGGPFSDSAVLTDITSNPKVAKREFYRTVDQKQTFASVCS